MGQGTEEQLTTDIEGTRQDLSRNLDALTDKVSPSQIMERRKQATKSRFRSMRDTVMGSAENARQSAASTGQSVSGTVTGSAQGAVGTIERQTEGNPLAAGLIAFGAGWLVSSLLPASQKEAQAAGQLVDRAKEHGQPLVDEAKQVGQEMGGQLKESATQAAQEVKSTAQDSAQTVKEEGQSSARTVKEEGASSAQNVSEDVRSRTQR